MLDAFEESMNKFKITAEQNQLIIRQFDVNLQTKSNKVALEELWEHINKKVSLKGEQEQFLKETAVVQKKIQNQLEYNSEIIEELHITTKALIEKEVLKATIDLRKSQFDQDATNTILGVNAKLFERKVDLDTFEKEMGAKGSKVE